MRAGYKRGVVRPEVLGHAHNHGGQIQTLKKKLHKLNANAQYTNTIVAMSQTNIQHSVTMGDILATVFSLSYIVTRSYSCVRAVRSGLPYDRSYSQAAGLFVHDGKRGPFLSGS